jgi:hypothetical protein
LRSRPRRQREESPYSASAAGSRRIEVAFLVTPPTLTAAKIHRIPVKTAVLTAPTVEVEGR